MQGGGGSAAACWSGLLRGAIRALGEALVAPGGPRAVVVGIGRGLGAVPFTALSCGGVVQGEVGVAAAAAGGTVPVGVGGVVPGGGGFWGEWAARGWTWWPGGYGSW